MEIRLGKISGELGVEQWFRKFHADAAQQMRMFFVTVHDHGMVIAVEQPLQALHHIRTEYVYANGFAVHGDHQCRKRGFSGFARAFGVKRPGLFDLVRAAGRRIDFEAEFRNVVGGAFMAFVQMFLHHGEMVRTHVSTTCGSLTSSRCGCPSSLDSCTSPDGLSALKVFSTRLLVRGPNSSSLNRASSSCQRPRCRMSDPRYRRLDRRLVPVR